MKEYLLSYFGDLNTECYFGTVTDFWFSWILKLALCNNYKLNVFALISQNELSNCNACSITSKCSPGTISGCDLENWHLELKNWQIFLAQLVLPEPNL
jgi:hypothetical protein